MNKVLIITYYWPPSGGAGVQRWLKFSRYLPQLGWEPVILTVDPEYAVYPALDPSLEKDIPEGIRIHRTKATNWFRIYANDKSRIPSGGFAKNLDDSIKGKISRFIRGNFFIPDPRRGWNRYVIRKACEIIEKEKIKHIITSSPPHSTQLIGLKLKKKYPHLKWIADLRDPWTDIYYYDQFYPTSLSRKIDLWFEKRVLKEADRIITVSNTLKSLFSSKSESIENKTDIITNGFDTSDFENITGKRPEKLTITYTGTLSEAYPVDGLVSALKKIRQDGTDFVIRLAGSVQEKVKQEIQSDIPSCFVEFMPCIAHYEAINQMVNSSVLLLIIPNHEHNKGIITGKIFEYLASGNPILCLGPVDGDAAKIISRCKAGKTIDYRNSDEIITFLKNIPLYASMIDKSAIQEFSRFNLTRQLASVLNSCS